MSQAEKSSEPQSQQPPSQSSEQPPSQSSEQPQPQIPQKGLPPWGVSFDDCKTDEEKKHAQDALNIWIDSINSEVHGILKKHNVNVYQISFWPVGLKIPIILASGDAYYTARLAAHAQSALEERAVQNMRGPLVKKTRPN